MRNIKLIIAYDGTHFFGWQKTITGRSIESVLEGAIEKIVQHPVVLQAASRTDRGVHALGQVVNFFLQKDDLDLKLLHYSINCVLPIDLRILSLTEVPDSFHPTTQALNKEYHYKLSTRPVLNPLERFYSWHYPYQLQIEKMREAAHYLMGKQDFSSLTNTKKNDKEVDFTRTLLEVNVNEKEEDTFLIVMRGDRFLFRMARNITGLLVYVGRGKINPLDIPEILAKKDRTLAGITAPAQGLILININYAILTS